MNILTAPRKKVLIADNDVDTVSFLKMFLAARGYDTFISHDGLNTITQARQCTPDFMILDIGLPLADGFEVARQIREYHELSDTIIIAYTGYAQHEFVRRALQSRIDFYVLKPTDADVLLACIEPERHSEILADQVYDFGGNPSLLLRDKNPIACAATVLSERSRKVRQHAQELCRREATV